MPPIVKAIVMEHLNSVGHKLLMTSDMMQDGVNWLAFLARYQLHGILCDDMGLGKTLQTLCILASDHYNRTRMFQVWLLRLQYCPRLDLYVGTEGFILA